MHTIVLKLKLVLKIGNRETTLNIFKQQLQWIHVAYIALQIVDGIN